METGEGDFGSQNDRAVLRRQEQALDSSERKHSTRSARCDSIDRDQAQIDFTAGGQNRRIAGQLQGIEFKAGPARVELSVEPARRIKS